MSLRATQNYQKFEANDVASFEDALSGALDAVEQQGIQGIAGEPNVIVILKHNGALAGNDKLVDAIVYIGATDAEVIADLQNPRP